MPPTLQHPRTTTIGIADYPKLVRLLTNAFRGTAQRGETLPIVYDEFGYQSHHVVEFKAGQIVPMRITPPDGRVSINAVPWAVVSIDGKPAGETPLGNVVLPVGEHQITFRHPQLGERTQKVIVKANTATRVSVSFAR